MSKFSGSGKSLHIKFKSFSNSMQSLRLQTSKMLLIWNYLWWEIQKCLKPKVWFNFCSTGLEIAKSRKNIQRDLNSSRSTTRLSLQWLLWFVHLRKRLLSRLGRKSFRKLKSSSKKSKKKELRLNLSRNIVWQTYPSLSSFTRTFKRNYKKKRPLIYRVGLSTLLQYWEILQNLPIF